MVVIFFLFNKQKDYNTTVLTTDINAMTQSRNSTEEIMFSTALLQAK